MDKARPAVSVTYYNENDPKAAEWLRELIRAGVIPPGDVDVRSVLEVRPHELTRVIRISEWLGRNFMAHSCPDCGILSGSDHRSAEAIEMLEIAISENA